MAFAAAALAWLAPVLAQAQSLVASTSSAAINQSNAEVKLAYTPGADSGSMDFEVRYSALATTSPGQVTSSIPNGTLACSLPVAGRLRCAVVATSGAVDLGAGAITVGFATGPAVGSVPLAFQFAHFFSQSGVPEPGVTTAGSLVLASTPTLSIADVNVIEGNAGTSIATFTLSLAPAAAGPVGFDIATDTGSATPGVDYEAKALVGQTIPAGQASASFTVVIDGDANVERNETFTVNLSNVTGAVVGRAQAAGTILNDDAATLSIADATVIEGNQGTTTASFRVTLSAPLQTPVTFDIGTASGTATAGSDFAGRNQVERLLDAGRTSAVFEVAVNGDAIAEPDETFSVAISNVTGAVLGNGVATGTILNDDGAVLTSIAQIQGSGPMSPLQGLALSTEGIVTALTADGFFMQSPDRERDDDPASSEGIAVACRDCAVAVGDRRRVDGLVQEVQLGVDPDQLTLTRIAATRTVLTGAGEALPRPIVLDAASTGPDRPIAGLERYEGMRIAMASMRVVGPSTGHVDAATGKIRDDGKFFGVARGVARPFREAGASVVEHSLPSNMATAERFDANPERLRVDTAGQRGAPAHAADVGDRVMGLVGVLSYGEGAYTVLPDPAAPLAVALGSRPQAVATRSPGTASIGILSLRGDGIGVDTAVEAIRLAKTANAVCHYAGAPDILAVSGVRGQATLDELARALNAADGNLLFPGSCHGNPGYQARLLPSAGTTGPRLGFIVRSSSPVAALRRVDVVSISRAGPAVTQRNPDGTREPLGVSPPLLLEAVIRRGNERSIAVTVVVAALSPLDADPAAIGSHGWRTRGEAARARRFAEAGTLGRLLRERQRTHPGEKLVVLGNFEASEFGDGHVDLLDLVANGPQPRAPRPVAPSLLNLTTRLPADERYSVVRDGNAQMVDHILVNRALLSEFPDAGIAVARINADFAEDNADDAGVPMRVSEHDPVLLLLDSAN